MCINKHATSFRLFALFLVVVIILHIGALAASNNAITPKASYYLSSYNTYAYNAAWGKVQIYFDVTGVNNMDEIGVLSIQLFESTDRENWNRVKTYTHDSTSGMLGYDKIYHSGHVDYSGTIGRYYKAYVCIWAGKDGDGDTRYYWTDVKKATLFAG